MSRTAKPDLVKPDGCFYRKCSTCNGEKLLEKFYEYKTGQNAGKRHRRCMECHKEYMRSWWRKQRGNGKGDEQGHPSSPKGNGGEPAGGVPNQVSIGRDVLCRESKIERGPSISLDTTRGRTGPQIDPEQGEGG